MSKNTNKINTIIVITIIVVSIITISNNFVKALQYKSYLKIDSSNREFVEKIISENYKLKGNLVEVAYMGGLGDWYLFLYYEDGTEDQTLFGDSDMNVRPLEKYIVENGYNEGEVSWNKIKISFGAIVITIIYEITYLIIKKIKKKQEERAEI